MALSQVHFFNDGVVVARSQRYTAPFIDAIISRIEQIVVAKSDGGKVFYFEQKSANLTTLFLLIALFLSRLQGEALCR